MNADVRRLSEEIAPHHLQLPGAALARLRLRLGHGASTGEAWAASDAYGVPPDALGELIACWRDDFQLEDHALFGLPCFEAQLGEKVVRFLHLRSHQQAPVPLLLLHGFSGSLAEFASLAEPLAASGVDVVCPQLSDFSWGDAPVSSRSVAEACSALMRRLGYHRYTVHGSDLGAGLALELAALPGAHVAAVHVTELPAYPETEGELRELSRAEKSRLARLTELHDELAFQLPQTPVEALAFALSRLEQVPALNSEISRQLLLNLTLSWALGEREPANALYRATRLVAAPVSKVPVWLQDFPLGAPSLRRWAERRYRVIEWEEPAEGGPMPAVEQPELLLESLRTFCDRVR